MELEIPHLYKTVARNSPKRPELEAKWNSFQVPYLEVRPALSSLGGCCIAHATSERDGLIGPHHSARIGTMSERH